MSAFTIVEFVVALTIMAIISTLGMISYFSFVSDSRDSVRLTDMHNMVSLMSISEVKTWEFPVVSNPIEVLFEGKEIWQEGFFWEESMQDVRALTEIPQDPLTWEYYSYSLSWRAWEFQISWVSENATSVFLNPFVQEVYANDFDSSIVRGTYNGKFLTYSKRLGVLENEVYILGLPSITSRSTENVEVNELIENQDLVYDNSKAVAWSYNRANEISDERWNFQPSVTGYWLEHNSRVVVYVGTNIELSTQDGKQDLIENLQQYYEGTNIENSESIDKLMNISLGEAESVIESFIDWKIGWLQNVRISKN